MRIFCAQRFVLWCASIDEQIHSMSISGISHPGIQLFGRRWMVLGMPTLTA